MNIDRNQILRERLHDIVKELGWSQKTLADRANIHPQQIYKVMSGERADPRSSTITKLADALGVTPNYLLGYEDAEFKVVLRPKRKRGGESSKPGEPAARAACNYSRAAGIASSGLAMAVFGV